MQQFVALFHEFSLFSSHPISQNVDLFDVYTTNNVKQCKKTHSFFVVLHYKYISFCKIHLIRYLLIHPGTPIQLS